MSGNDSYYEQLGNALQTKREHLESTALPEIKNRFAILHAAFRNVYEVLIQKSLISEDPYKYDRKISEVSLPDSTPITDNTKSGELGLRLSHYDSQLEFLTNSYQFSIDFLTLKRIKLLAGLAKFIHWGALSETSTKANTRAVADLFAKIRGGSDTFSTQMLSDAQNRMSAASAAILSRLKELTDFHRESYKYEVRTKLIANLDLSREEIARDREAALSEIRKRFNSGQTELPFYQDLVKEILDEDYTGAGKTMRENTLKKLAVEKKKTAEPKEVSYKQLLLEAVRLLATASRHLEAALDKINENSSLFEESKLSSGGPLKKLLRKFLFGTQQTRIYEVEFVDVATSVGKEQSINFDTFLQESTRTARILGSLASKMSNSYSQLESKSEDEIYKLLERRIVDLQKIVRALPALQTCFQSEIDREDRGKLKGIKLELNAIRNAIVKANQKRHEYVSRKEEEEQLRKLGVSGSGDSGSSAGARQNNS